jgi:peptide/nickel transport system substrate-binding protein
MLTRKLWSLLAVLMALALVISACAPAATPAPTQPPAPTEAPAQPTAMPAPTEAPTAMPAPTEAPTEAPQMALMSKAAPDCNWGGTLKSIEAVDESTVKFTMCVPDPAFPSKAAFSSLGIQSAKHLQDTGGKPLEDALGTGPYVVKEWVRGDHLTLEPNPNYWGDKPKTGTVIFKWNAEAAARLTSLQSGEADGIDNPDPNDYKTIQGDSTLKLYPREALNVFYLGINNTKPPFDNEMVRQAIAMGIDRQAIVDKYYPPGSSVADYFTPCAIPGGCEGDPWYKYDPVAAKDLLTKAGFPNGFKTTLSYRDVVRGYLPTPGKVAEELQAQLKKNLGIDATIDVQESGTFLDNASKGNLALHLLGWGADYPDQTDFLDYHFGKGASDQFGKKFDDLTAVLAQAASLADQTERNKLYAQANDLVKQHVPMVPVAHGGSADAFKATVEGAYSDPLSGEQFRLMSIPGQDQLVWVQNAEPISLYCSDETDGETLRACEQIFDPLLHYKPGGTEVEPGLATACTPNADLTEWTCTLRAAKFSDGTAVTANDVVATYAVQWDAADPLHTGSTGNFDYWSAFFGGFLNPPKQ